MANIIKKYELDNEEMQYLSLLIDSVKERKKIDTSGNIIIRKLHNGIIDFSVYPLQVQKNCKECEDKKRIKKKSARDKRE